VKSSQAACVSDDGVVLTQKHVSTAKHFQHDRAASSEVLA